MSRKSLPVAAALAVCLVAAGCGSSSSSSSTASSTTAAAQAGTTVGGVQLFKVTSPATGAMQYNPSTLTAKAGKVTITYTNLGPIAHNIAIFDAKRHELGTEMDPFAKGSKKTTATLKAGTYTYECQVAGHAAAGMKGTIVVS